MTKHLLHPGVSHPEYLAEICAPLKQLNISYFGHVQIDAAGNFSSINNHPDFHLYYIKNKYYNNDIFMARENMFNHFVVWDNVIQAGKSQTLYREGFEFGLRHTFTIIEIVNNIKNYYYFATKNHNESMNQNYINYLPLLQLFILHFKDKLNNSKVLKRAYDIKFALDKKLGAYETMHHAVISKNEELEGFIKALKINKVYLENLVGKRGLTKRELEVLIWLNQGKTVGEVATILSLSQTTVNSYLLSLKEKFAVRTLFQLGSLFSSSFSAHKFLNMK